jgi:hypothetical protein
LLFPPVADRDDGAKVAFRDGVAAVWQEEKGFLDARREVQQIHDLRYPRLRDVRQPGKFRLVGNHPLSDKSRKTDRERHQAGDAGDSSALDACVAGRT